MRHNRRNTHSRAAFRPFESIYYFDMDGFTLSDVSYSVRPYYHLILYLSAFCRRLRGKERRAFLSHHKPDLLRGTNGHVHMLFGGGRIQSTLSANRQIFGFASADATNDLYDLGLGLGFGKGYGLAAWRMGRVQKLLVH